MDIQQKEHIEIDFWKESEFENPDRFTEENYRNKSGDAAIFKEILKKYDVFFNNANVILEVGAGQGWASCIVKKEFPVSKVISSDISPWAIASLKYWEDVYETKIDNSFTAKSYSIPLEDSVCDLIFCFSAAHHFADYDSTLKEIYRVLKPQGHCLWFYEPSSPRLFYKLVKKRLNSNRLIVPEDVIVISDIRKYAKKYDLSIRIDFFPNYQKRGPIEKKYFYILSKLPFLNYILPSTINVIISKP